MYISIRYLFTFISLIHFIKGGGVVILALYPKTTNEIVAMHPFNRYIYLYTFPDRKKVDPKNHVNHLFSVNCSFRN